MTHSFDYQLRWKNFRCFEDTGWLDIKPLTILIGPNSAGKTSLTAPFLLMNQTMSSRDNSTALVTRGSLCDVGSFEDMTNQETGIDEVFFGFRFHSHKRSKDIKDVGSYPPGAVEVTLDSLDGSPALKSYVIYDIFNRLYLRMRRGRSGEYRLSGPRMKDLSGRERKAVSGSDPINFLFSPSSALRGFFEQKSKDTKRDDIDQTEGFSKDFSEYLNLIGFSFEELREFYSDMSYIGPLREKPKRLYELSGEVPNSVGSRGQNTASLLFHKWDEVSECVNRWVRRFEFGTSLRVSEEYSGVFSIEFGIEGQPDKFRNIADTGFGASQILPLITQAAAAASDSFTIAEQPEIHLNPHLQYVLGDLFAEMTDSGHRIIVETHSEHLLLRIRRLIAQGRLRSEDVALYFIECTDGVSSVVKDIPISSDGHIDGDDWPTGFLEDGLAESLALAADQINAHKRETSNAQ